MTVNKEKIVKSFVYYDLDGFGEFVYAKIIQTEDGKFSWEISHHYKPEQNAGIYYPSTVSGDSSKEVEKHLNMYVRNFTIDFGIKKNLNFIFEDGMFGDEHQKQTNKLVDWFYENFQDPSKGGGAYHESKEGGYHGDIRDASDELQNKFPNEYYDIIEAAVEEIESHGGHQWIPIYGSEASLTDELETLMDSLPKPKTAPTFDVGPDNLFHITLPPDNQPVNSQDVSLKKLRDTIEALLKSRIWANRHPELTPIVKEYKDAISGDKVSISEIYWSGVKFDNAVEILEETLSFNAKLELKTALDKHGSYIVLDEEGRRLVEASATYSQSAKQTQEIKQAIEKLSNTITESRNVLGDDIRKHVSSALKDIGQGQHPERSNQSVGNTLTNLVSGILDWIKRSSTETIFDLVINKVVEGVLGAGLIVAGVVAHNAALLLVNIAPLLLIILAPLAGELTWVASAAELFERIRLMINSKK